MKKKVKKEVPKKKINIFKYIISDKKLVVASICLVLFLILSILLICGKTTRLDELMSSFIIGVRNDSLTKRMINITNIGGVYSLVSISLLLLIFIKKKKIPFFVIINLITVFLTSQLFKIIFRRPRPDGLFLIHESGYSFPSGHMMVSLSYIIFIIYILYKVLKSNLSKTLTTIALIIIAVLIGFSRIYLGVHYFTDIMAGILLAISYTMIFIHIVDKKGFLK